MSRFEGQNTNVSDSTAGRTSDSTAVGAGSSEIQRGLNDFSNVQRDMKGPDTSNLQPMQLFDSKTSGNNNSSDAGNVRVAENNKTAGDSNVASDANSSRSKPDVKEQINSASEALDYRLSPTGGARQLQDSLTDARSKFGQDQQGFNDKFVKGLAEQLNDSPQVKANGSSIEFRGKHTEGIRANYDGNGKAHLETFSMKDGKSTNHNPQDVIDVWNRKKAGQ